MSDQAYPWDQRIASASTAADQCMKLGGVILPTRATQPTGFRVDAPSEGEQEERGRV